ncbi:fungal-specific transcription factor domain-containing protein [Mortierella sp. GBAus27b]|nr:fungal-specific transcription factor domain-containing protein [Mortierella sp. GBAus27b]
MADGPPHPVPYNSHLAFTPPPSSNMDPAMDQPQAARQKRLKAGTACTNCRRKKLRCTGTPNCARCVTHNLDCVVDEALFLKTNNSSSSLCSRTPSRPSQSSSSSSSIHHGYPHQSYHRSSKSGNPMQFSTLNTIQLGGPMDRGSMSTSSYSGDEMVERNDNVDYLSDRRLSASSATSFSSLSPSPSPAFSYNYTQSQSHYNSSSYQSSKKHSSKKSSYRSDSGAGHLDSHPSSSSSSRPFSSSSYPGAMDAGSPMSQSSSGMSKKRVSKDQDTVKTKHKRRDSRPSRDSDPGSPSPLLSPQDSSSIDGSMSSSNAKGDDFKSVVSTLSLDGHGQHFHGSSSGFYVCQLSSRYRQGVYPLPMAHLNDSDLWSHSLKMTSESELPSKAEMDNLLGLYFRYMYPFAPMFIRKSFMDQHASKRPDLAQILILNAIFCNACWYSDDPMIKQDSTKYFNRAKIILDETYHVSRVSAVQALLLMSHHQYAVGNYSGGWLYTGMASRIAHDIGLHRQDVQVNEPEEAEIRRRVWWAVYIADRLGGGILGRPLNLRDKEYNVQMPSGDWIDELGWDDAVEYPYEPERIISCRLLWTVKLFMQMGNVLNTMHCIEAEINGAFLADISRTQLPQLHNSLTSWFLSLPNELMYTPYTMSPNSNHPPSPPTALMHMFYYTTLTMLHRPYLRPVNSAAIDANFLVSSRNICTAAATNVCHIADSLMLHGQLRDTCYYGMACLLAAGTVHVHNAITPTPSNRETTRAGLSKTVKAAHELVKTFPVAESLIAVALDVFASQTSSMPTEVAASFIDISTFVAPFMDVTQLQSTSIGNIYEAARLAKLAKDGPGPAPSIQLRHPYGNFSMPLPEGGKDHQNSTKLSSLWQNQIAAAVAMAAIAFGGTDPQQEQQFFANPLELPESLRLAPIDIFQVDATTGLARSAWSTVSVSTAACSSATTTAGSATTFSATNYSEFNPRDTVCW